MNASFIEISTHLICTTFQLDQAFCVAHVPDLSRGRWGLRGEPGRATRPLSRRGQWLPRVGGNCVGRSDSTFHNHDMFRHKMLFLQQFFSIPSMLAIVSSDLFTIFPLKIFYLQAGVSNSCFSVFCICTLCRLASHQQKEISNASISLHLTHFPSEGRSDSISL